MPGSRRSPPDQPAQPFELRIAKETVRERLTELIERGRVIADTEWGFGAPSTTQEDLDDWRAQRSQWIAFAKEVLVRSFTSAEARDEFSSAVSPGVYVWGGGENPVADFERDCRDVRDGIVVLKSLIERLDLLDDPAPQAARAHHAAASTTSRAVFIVHGRDEGIRDRVARALGRLGFEPIILAEQPNEGRTLIEKFETNALDVGFAVVILTPEDYAHGPDEADMPTRPNRARQNVVLELGYFMGKLGRDRVCPIYAGGTETPSDIHGLAYVPLDEGGAWQFKLGAELAAAGYEVDLNALR